jgi:hypothetical protein
VKRPLVIRASWIVNRKMRKFTTEYAENSAQQSEASLQGAEIKDCHSRESGNLLEA